MIQVLQTQPNTEVDRYDAFREFAQWRAVQDVVQPPTTLSPEERRLYVRQTMREDNIFRIRNRPEGAKAKFDKLTSSLFKFFRGTALLFHRDIAGTDAHLPTVLAIGDVHPENFGVMPNKDGAPFFGVNDFDEAYFAPFSWDVKRGAVGFWIAAKQNGFKHKKRDKVVAAFVKGYIDGLMEFAQDDREKWHQFRLDNSPPMIVDLLENAKASRREFLAELLDLEKGRFHATKEIVPQTSDVAKFQEVIDQYQKENDIDAGSRAGHFEVKDVAVKKESGTASLGLDRFFVLIDGPSDDHADDVVLEMKHSRRSALAGLVADDDIDDDEEAKADRIVQSHEVHLVGGDMYFGHAEMDDRSFLIKERSPYKDDIDIDDLDSDGMQTYADICGRTLASSHARSDEDTGLMEGDAEKRILESIDTRVFIDDIVRFAREMSKRIKKDYKAFCQDHDLGAFEFVRAQ